MIRRWPYALAKKQWLAKASTYVWDFSTCDRGSQFLGCLNFQNAGSPSFLLSSRVWHHPCSSHFCWTTQSSACVGTCSLSLDNEFYTQSLCQHEHLQHAIDLLSRVNQALSVNTYMCLLRACNKRKSVVLARQVCKHVTHYNTQVPSFLGNYLVITLANCGAIPDAESVFGILSKRTVFSWTALISAHAFRGQAEEAIRMHTLMQEDGVKLNSYTYVILLKACGSLQNLNKGREIHDEIRTEGFTADVFVGSTLISMYGKCGDIANAEIVFLELAQRNLVTWNAMLSAYVEQNQGRKALQCYRQMQEERTGSDQRTFLFAVQTCQFLIEQEKSSAVERWPMAGLSLHIITSLYCDARREGFTSDVFVGSTFTRMFGKCAAIAESEHAFSSLTNRNMVSWTAMLAGYVEYGAGVKALQLYKQMHAEGFCPDSLAAVGALQACCSLVDAKELVKCIANKTIAIEIGQAIGVDYQSDEAARDVVFSTALQTMYGKCGGIVEAENTFGAMSERSVVSWSALLAIFVDQGHMEKALQLYRQMQTEFKSPGRYAVVSALQAVCSLASCEEVFSTEGEADKRKLLQIGYGLHNDAQRQGFLSDIFIANTLVHMYGKCRAIMQAEAVFVTMPRHNVVSWTAMLSVYLEQGQGSRVLQLYMQMLNEGITPDHLTLVINSQACGVLADKEEVLMSGKEKKIIALDIGLALHDDFKSLGMRDFDNLFQTTLINLYGRCGAVREAEDVFKNLKDPDVVSWSAMLSAYVDQDQGEMGLLLYRQMHQEGIQVDPVTTVVILRACSIFAEMVRTLFVSRSSVKAAALEIGFSVHAAARKSWCAHDLAVGNTILNMYGKCGSLVNAEHVFEVLYPRNVVTWNAMISCYAEHGQEEKALMLYREMQKHSVTVDDVTLVFTLRACCMIGCLILCNLLHFDIVCAGCDVVPSLAASLIHAYSSCASTRDAYLCLDQLTEANVGSWNACITGYIEGCHTTSLHLLENLVFTGKKPDAVTFTSILSACSRTGHVNEGEDYFVSMSHDYELIPEGKHYGCILDLLARAGAFRKAESILATMPVEADETVWLCVLGACQTHCNVDFAEFAFDCALRSHPKDAAAYVALSNVYAYARYHGWGDDLANSVQGPSFDLWDD